MILDWYFFDFDLLTTYATFLCCHLVRVLGKVLMCYMRLGVWKVEGLGKSLSNMAEIIAFFYFPPDFGVIKFCYVYAVQIR